MAKRFCKLNRRDITEHLGEIHNLVTEPKFVCRACARSSSDQANLCKPSVIPPASCQSKSDMEKAACGLLAETLPTPEVALADLPSVELEVPQDNAVQMFDPALITEPSDKTAKKAKASKSDSKDLKRMKKSLKKQDKYNKKLAKVVKQQQKLLKKSQKLESQFERMNAYLDNAVLSEGKTAVNAPHIH